MGLDMYLYENRYLSHFKSLAESDKPGHYKTEWDISEKVCELADLKPIDSGGVHVRACVMYWRKANAIHAWFVNQVVPDGQIDNSQDWYLERDTLVELRDICQKVLDGVQVEHREAVATGGYTIAGGVRTDHFEPGRVVLNPEFCEELLPSQSGFFFGETDYNEWYLQDLEYTVEGLTRVLVNQHMSSYERDGETVTFPDTEFYYHPSW